MESERQIIVVEEGDPLLRDLGGIPTPMLLDLSNDGQYHEAWPMPLDDKGNVQWRARDDAFDAKHKPADVPYTRVIAGLNPRYTDPWDR